MASGRKVCARDIPAKSAYPFLIEPSLSDFFKRSTKAAQYNRVARRALYRFFGKRKQLDRFKARRQPL
jgi:hypothetical protein